jgi:hypothetical protein
MPLGDKYKPLTEYLLLSGKDSISLSFEQLEEITGGLPPSVYTRQGSWSNSSKHSLSYGWHNADYSIQVDFMNRVAVFTKNIASNTNTIKKAKGHSISESSKKKQSRLRKLGKEAVSSITKERIDEAFKIVMESESYGEESKALERIINRFPSNNNPDDIIIKLAIVDVTHSTQLAKQKRNVSIDKLAKAMSRINNLDARMKLGELNLVTEIAELTSIDLLSIASKYCTCHNQFLYGKDDYFKFDNIVSKMIGHSGRDYIKYCKILDEIIDEKGIRYITGIRRKLDCYLWYYGRKNKIQ